MLPALRITSRVARTVVISPPIQTSAPVQRLLPSGCFSITSRLTCAEVHILKLGRPSHTGRRKAFAVFQRQPFFWLTRK